MKKNVLFPLIPFVLILFAAGCADEAGFDRAKSKAAANKTVLSASQKEALKSFGDKSIKDLSDPELDQVATIISSLLAKEKVEDSMHYICHYQGLLIPGKDECQAFRDRCLAEFKKQSKLVSNWQAKLKANNDKSRVLQILKGQLATGEEFSKYIEVQRQAQLAIVDATCSDADRKALEGKTQNLIKASGISEDKIKELNKIFDQLSSQLLN